MVKDKGYCSHVESVISGLIITLESCVGLRTRHVIEPNLRICFKVLDVLQTLLLREIVIYAFCMVISRSTAHYVVFWLVHRHNFHFIFTQL